MARTYEEEIAAARERLNQSLAETAADVVVLAERFGKTIHAVAKDVTEDQPELFNSIKARSSRMEKARSETDSESSGPSPAEAKHVGSAKAA